MCRFPFCDQRRDNLSIGQNNTCLKKNCVIMIGIKTPISVDGSMNNEGRGQRGLTTRKLLVARGLPNKQIARQLNISEGTVKVHLHQIYSQFNIRNRTVMVALVRSMVTAP